MKKDDTPAVYGDAQIDEKIAWLDTCRTALDERGSDVLDEVLTPFMRKHYGEVRRRALRWGVPESDVQDLLQEIFLAFHARVRDRGVKRNLLTTLNIVARGKLLHDLRARRAARESLCFPSTDSALPASPRDLDKAIDLRTLARFSMHILPENYRAVVQRMVLEQWTAPEAAADLGLPEGTVKSQLLAAEEMMRARTKQWPASQRDTG